MLIVNGKPMDLQPMPETVQALLEHLQIENRRLIVEKNRQVVDPSRHGEERLAAGDRIEIVHFVGGG